MPSQAIVLSDDEQIKKNIKETFFLVEASSFERQALWERHHEKTKWEGISLGFTQQVGELDHRPVVISIFWSRVDGKLVAFWEATSEVVDHKMIEDWFRENIVPPKWDNDRRNARCDASNFQHCLQAIQNAKQAKWLLAVASE